MVFLLETSGCFEMLLCDSLKGTLQEKVTILEEAVNA